MELRTAHLGNRVMASAIGAAALAATFGAGSASAAVDGGVIFKAEGKSIVAAIDAVSNFGSGENVTCKLDAKSQAAGSTPKTTSRTDKSGDSGVLSESLRIDNLQPGKYDVKVNCADSNGDQYSLTKTDVVEIAGAKPAAAATTSKATTPTGIAGIMSTVKQFLTTIINKI
ncbi:hypothetical protein [Smaragdicoccus niigatensis]|uniref:hypothetical protein n=1 Tax=Smaragdicoccus niigatensis TaxID=359359 RepID=UPI00039FE3E3|nr:hypothetical protein [Smaragdicoccus niigatensis]